MEYAVDMQGFERPGKEFVLKELAIYALNIADNPAVLLFKPPFSWTKLTEKYKRKNRQLELRHHGLSWDKGDYEYSELGKILRDALRDATRIFVIGDARKQWLERFNFNVSDITEWGFQPLDRPKCLTLCTNHNGACKTECALQNVKLMKSFYISATVMEWEEISVEQMYI